MDNKSCHHLVQPDKADSKSADAVVVSIDVGDGEVNSKDATQCNYIGTIKN